MCTVSMVGDFYGQKWREHFVQPQFHPLPHKISPPGVTTPFVFVGKDEFDQLKREVMDMKELLKRAIKYDKDNGEPECQLEEKMALLRAVAKAVGVDLDDVIGKAP